MASKKSNIKIIIITVLAVVALVLSVIAVGGFAPKIKLYLTDGGKVVDGLLPDVEEHIAEVPDGEIRYLINKRINFEDKYALGNVMLENPDSCEYSLEFAIYNGDGQLIYNSPRIDPGQCLERDKLSAVVKSGEYECSYVAKAYQNNEYKGEVSGVLTVTVG